MIVEFSLDKFAGYKKEEKSNCYDNLYQLLALSLIYACLQDARGREHVPYHPVHEARAPGNVSMAGEPPPPGPPSPPPSSTKTKASA